MARRVQDFFHVVFSPKRCLYLKNNILLAEKSSGEEIVLSSQRKKDSFSANLSLMCCFHCHVNPWSLCKPVNKYIPEQDVVKPLYTRLYTARRRTKPIYTRPCG